MALTINRPWRPPERNVRAALPYDCDAPCTMTNRSDRRWKNPEMSKCHEHDGAIGSQCATSSSRPSILRSEGGGGRIYVCSRHGRQSCGMLATGEESIYGPWGFCLVRASEGIPCFSFATYSPHCSSEFCLRLRWRQMVLPRSLRPSTWFRQIRGVGIYAKACHPTLVAPIE